MWIPDPNFSTLTLYNTVGNVLQVNSENEKNYYLDNGWSTCPQKQYESYALPSICSINVSVPENPKPGDIMTISYEVTKGTSELSRMNVWFENKTLIGSRRINVNPRYVSTSGTYNFVIPDSWTDGEYILVQLFIEDASGGNIHYEVDGSAQKSPSNALGGDTSHSLFSSKTLFTIDNQKPSYTLPSIRSINVSVPENPKPGDIMTISYEVTKGTSELSRMNVWFENKTLIGSRRINVNPRYVSTSGTYNFVIPDSWTDGEYILVQLFIEDASGGNIHYEVDGSAQKSPSNALGGDTSHSLFSSKTLFTIDN